MLSGCCLLKMKIVDLICLTVTTYRPYHVPPRWSHTHTHFFFFFKERFSTWNYVKSSHSITDWQWYDWLWFTVIVLAESKVILRLPVCVCFYCDLCASFSMSVLFSCVFNCLFFSRSSVYCFPNPSLIFTFSICISGNCPMTETAHEAFVRPTNSL